MSDLGARIRQAREEKGITLEQAEEATHIRRSLLRAIEEGHYEELPADVYGRGLVRNYARYLGIDSQAAVQEYLQHTGRPQLVIPQMLSEPLAPRRPRWGWLLIPIVIALLALAAWYLCTTNTALAGWRIEKLWPPAISRPNVEVTEQLTTVGQGISQNTPVAEQTVPSVGETPDTTSTPQPTATGTATPTLMPTVTPSPTPITGVLIEARALAETYVEVTLDGELYYTGILQPDDTAEWHADQVIALRVGNAGGLSLVVNGYDVGTLGASGQVMTLEYAVDNLPGQ